MLREVFGTKNPCTLPMSGTGSAGMETCLVNLVEPGDHVLVGVNGVFGTRLAEVARRAGAEVTAVESEWGRALGALLVADTVTSLGGVPVELDAQGIDASYSGTQKCLSSPPGLAPVSLSPRALAKLEARAAPVQSWYLDLSLLIRYWGQA